MGRMKERRKGTTFHKEDESNDVPHDQPPVNRKPFIMKSPLPEGTLAMSDSEYASDGYSSLVDTPKIVQKPSRPRPSAIPLSPNFNSAEAQTPTIKISELGMTPNFKFQPPHPSSPLGRLVPIYSFRNIIPLSASTITLGSDPSCTISSLYDTRISN